MFGYGAGNPPKPPVVWNGSAEDVSSLPSGVGYGGTGWDWVPARMRPTLLAPPPPSPPADDEDLIYAHYFNALSLVLPRRDSADQFDESPPCPELLRELLTRSPLLTKAAELLRNNSIDDIVKRHNLYRALLEFLRITSLHRTTRSVMVKPVTLYPPEEQLLGYCVQPPDPASSAPFASAAGSDNGKGKARSYEETSSLVEILRKTNHLFRGIMKHASTHKAEFETEDGPKMLEICRGYTALADIFGGGVPAADRSRIQGPPSASGCGCSAADKDASAGDRRAAFAAWHRENCVLDAPEVEMLKAFYYANLINAMGVPARGRMKKLIMDINTMRMSLPEGIFIRHGSSRMDALKVLIAGPADTPYEGGLFEFDMLCPANFPLGPPQMRLKTTGSGSVRFNPNLYPDGTGMFPCYYVFPRRKPLTRAFSS